MSRHRAPLVVIALVLAAGLVAWLAREEAERSARRAPAGASRERPRPPRVDLAPPGSAAAPGRGEARRGNPLDPQDGALDPLAVGPGPAAAPGAASIDPPPSIRGVRGVVLDAATRTPIEGAWITWRCPGPEDLARVLDGEGPVQGADTGMVTDAAGRFDVDRLPDDEQVSYTLFASARGYGTEALRPGLRDDVVFELAPMGTLELRVPDGYEELPDVPLGALFELRSVEGDLVVGVGSTWTNLPPGDVLRASNLRPGRWRARFVDADVGAVEVPAGGVARLEVAAPRLVKVTGTVLGQVAERRLEFVAPGRDSTNVARLEDGRFALELLAGRYAVFTLDDGVRRRLAEDLEVRPGLAPLTLAAPPEGHEVSALLQRLEPGVVATVTLFALDGSDVRRLHGERGAVQVGRARAGRHAAVDGGRWFLGFVDVPSAGLVVLDGTRSTVTVRFVLPRALRADEALRGRLRLVPEGLERLEQHLTGGHEALRLSAAAPTAPFHVKGRGRYVLTGETDLGPFRAVVDLGPGVTEVVVPLE